MGKLRRKPQKAGVRKCPSTPAERLEPRLLLSATRFAEIHDPLHAAAGEATSNGVYAYYYTDAAEGKDIYRTDGSPEGTRKVGTVPEAFLSNFELVDGELFFRGW